MEREDKNVSDDPVFDLLYRRMSQSEEYRKVYDKIVNGDEITETDNQVLRSAFVELISLDDIFYSYRDWMIEQRRKEASKVRSVEDMRRDIESILIR